MVSAAVAFRIVTAAAAARPVSLSVDLVPVANATCRPAAQACFATVRMSVRNDSTHTVLLDDYQLTLSERRAYHGIFTSSSLAPGAAIVVADPLFELHVEAIQTLRVRYHLDGERDASRTHVMSERPASLSQAALAACMRCNGGKEALCVCSTGDRNRRCTEAAQCEGVCIFDRIQELPPTCTPGPNQRCAAWPGSGYRVGYCSETLVPVGCMEVLSKDDSPSRPIALLAGHSHTCYDAAALVHPTVNDSAAATGSSRRR
ncbi:MAG TPA: hypothetical protein VN903_31435 [Polyangia bacterium]|jgi:hypothetical protein|nr:hypothetical protein [Polyangia bacterium]